MSVEFLFRAFYVLLCLVSVGHGAMLTVEAGLTDNQKAKDTSFCKLTAILRIPTQDEISVDIPKANCDTDGQAMMEDGTLLTCHLDPTGSSQVPDMTGYALQGGVYRQAQSMLDKEFIVYCCDGTLSLAACPAKQASEAPKASKASKEKPPKPSKPSKCPDSRYWVHYAHSGKNPPKSELEWDFLHSSLGNTSIRAPCVKISKLRKSRGGISDRFIGGGNVCGDVDMEIRLDKKKDGYYPYLMYTVIDDSNHKFWLKNLLESKAFRKNDGVRIVGCCDWTLDQYKIGVSARSGGRPLEALAPGSQGKAIVAQRLVTWMPPSSAITLETCDDF